MGRLIVAPDNHSAPIYPHLIPSLLIGVPSIDKEHDELVAQLAILMDNPDALPETECFSVVLSQLEGQINAHFTNEEEFFKSLGMPENEISNHVKAHTIILEQYSRLNLDLMQGKAFSRTKVLLMIKDWIIGHVVCFDLNLKKYLPKTKGSASKGTNRINS